MCLINIIQSKLGFSSIIRKQMFYIDYNVQIGVHVFSSSCIKQSWLGFKNTVLSVLDSLAPVKEIRLKQRTESWMSGEVLDLISQRDTFLYTFKKHNLQDDYRSYCKLRNRVQKEINMPK